MGFRQGAYAKVWEVKPKGATQTTLRISTSRKNRQTEQYEQDFSGFVDCFGSAAATQAMGLNKGDTIKLGDCDVTTRYDAEKRITYTNFKLFSFEKQQHDSGHSVTAPDSAVYEGNAGDMDGADVPF